MNTSTSTLTSGEGNHTSDLCIEVEGLQFSYNGRSEQRVIDIPEWRVNRGQQLFLHGPSGAGKSTLLNLVAGILAPTKGRIKLIGQEFSTLSARKRDTFRARHIGVVFQQFNLVPYLSVLENVQLAAYFALTLQTDVQSSLLPLLTDLHLHVDILTKRADTLSVGQQQRVAIVRALINRPEILIVDEPTSALDSKARDSFMAMLMESAKHQNATLLFVSHDKSLAGQFDQLIDIQQLNRQVT